MCSCDVMGVHVMCACDGCACDVCACDVCACDGCDVTCACDVFM